MTISTSYDIPGKEVVEILGVVRGNTIRARAVGKDIIAGLRNLVGGEITEYTKMVAEAREQALDRMLAEARQLNADAVIGVRFMTNSMMQGAAELLAYGTAVRLADRARGPGE